MLDIAEGVNIKTEIYNVDLSKMKSLYRNDSYSRGQMGPRMIAARLGDISLNYNSDRDETPKEAFAQKNTLSGDEAKELRLLRNESHNPPSQMSSIIKDKFLDTSMTPLKVQNSEQNESQIKSGKKEVEQSKEESPSMKPLLQSQPTVGKPSPANKGNIFEIKAVLTGI